MSPPTGRPGSTLPSGLRFGMEAFFDADLSTVRIHVGQEAESLGAVAFAHGEDVHFARGHYQPDTSGGVELLAHELTHVLQQRGGRTAGRNPAGPALLHDPVLEAEADRLGRQARVWIERGRRPADFRPVDGAARGVATRPVIQAKMIFTGDSDRYEGTRYLDIDLNSKIPSKVFKTIQRQAKNLAGTIFVGFADKPQATGSAMYSAVSANTGKLTLSRLSEEQITEAGADYHGLLAAMVHETQHAIDHLSQSVVYNGHDEATLRAEWRAWAIEAALIYELDLAGKPISQLKAVLPGSYRSKSDFANKNSTAFGRTMQYLDYCNVIAKPNVIQTSNFIMQKQGWLHEAILMFYSHVEGGIGGAVWPGDGSAAASSESDMEEVY
ncbi:DUF4157 domain-containing protein [Corallococcus sp. CA053C]|uniref:eCIS core domain-containing protein n=1 Tax=Corallococcus sp. CA053C TaxID=2316732 RepID=UPI000EA32999|nr:DUF4157 domain-containing protein [Corallococcus sp. CA053C]RKH02668.1 DUF4157 domain-containing protein [Corallococcus sp. CA053C]